MKYIITFVNTIYYLDILVMKLSTEIHICPSKYCSGRADIVWLKLPLKRPSDGNIIYVKLCSMQPMNSETQSKILAGGAVIHPNI